MSGQQNNRDDIRLDVLRELRRRESDWETLSNEEKLVLCREAIHRVYGDDWVGIQFYAYGMEEDTFTYRQLMSEVKALQEGKPVLPIEAFEVTNGNGRSALMGAAQAGRFAEKECV